MFTVEMLPAQQGDALWIEYGTPPAVHRVLVDGGTAPTAQVIAERIRRLPVAERAFELLIVTHIDTDHIGGVLRLLADPPDGVSFRDVWFNDWAVLPPCPEPQRGPIDGAILTDILGHRAIDRNKAFRGAAVQVPAEGDFPVATLAGGLRLTVLSPTAVELARLACVWQRVLRQAGLDPDQPAADPLAEKARRKGVLVPRSLGAKDVDALADSPFTPDRTRANGTSIAVLAEYWLDWQRAAVTWRLREISQLVESGADPPDGELGHRLYHRSITEFLAEYEYSDTDGLWQNLYFVNPVAQHERLVSYYLGKLAKDWNGTWSRCDGYGLRRLVSHLRSRWELAENDTAGAAEDLYRVALDPGFQAAQRDRTGGVHTTLNSLRTALEVALEEGSGHLVPALRATAAFRALTAAESLSRAVFAAVAARDLPMAVQKMTHYTTGPEATGGWPALLQLYLAWEAAEAGALEEMTDLVAQAGAYPSALADALLTGTAHAAARHAHDPAHWLAVFGRDGVAPPVPEVTRDVMNIERVVRQLEVAAEGAEFNPLSDPEGMTDSVLDIQDGLRAMIATGAGHNLLERAVAAAVRNPYPRYRDTALQALGTAALAATDHGWTARQLQQILRAGLDDEGVTFTFDLPALLVAAGERRGLRMPALSQYLDQATAAQDTWGTRLRALSAQAAAAHWLGTADRAAELLIDSSRQETTYAGYGVMAALALDDRCREVGRPDLADAPRWGNQGDQTLSQLAGDLAGRVWDPMFSGERTNLVRAHREWRSAPVPEPDAVAERLAQLPDRDARAAYRNHVAARWSAAPATAASVRTLVPGALFDTTGLDGLLARVVGAALPELSDDQLQELAALVSEAFTTGRPWTYAQWR